MKLSQYFNAKEEIVEVKSVDYCGDTSIILQRVAEKQKKFDSLGYVSSLTCRPQDNKLFSK